MDPLKTVSDLAAASGSSILSLAQAQQNYAVSLRRHLHAHPELSLQEHATAEFVAAKLSEIGYRVTTGMAQTGLVGDFGSGTTVAMMAELDALPIAELNRSLYTSKNAGVSHACGHDVNMACVVMAGKLLAHAQLPGRIRAIFMPGAEERGTKQGLAAQTMIERGALKDVSALLAIHVDTTIPAGKVGVIVPDPAAISGNSTFTISIESAAENQSRDALFLALSVVQKILNFGSLKASHYDPAELIVTSIQNEGTNPDTGSKIAVIKGAFQTYSHIRRLQLRTDLEQACAPVNTSGVTSQIDYQESGPQNVISPSISQLLLNAATELIGRHNVLQVKRQTWTDTLSHFTHITPGALLLLGGGIAGSRRSHHTPTFDIDESGLSAGAAILAETAQRLIADFNSASAAHVAMSFAPDRLGCANHPTSAQ